MSLQQWLEYGWLRSHETSKKEIADLLRIIARDVQDAAGHISADWRFGKHSITVTFLTGYLSLH